MKNNHINYMELKATNLSESKILQFFIYWKFENYGDNYTASSSSGLDGGFEKIEKKSGFTLQTHLGINLPFGVSFKFVNQ